MNNQLKSLSQLMLPRLDDEMRLVFKVNDGKPDPFYGMMQYHMGWVNEDFQPVLVHGGKRIRPLLTMLSCQASAGDWTSAIPAAAAVEIVHNFSLVHDDIEDISPTRRGRETVWKIWGEAQAINCGDAMYALAHLALVQLANNNVPSATVVRALRRFDETCLSLTQGQYNDMDFEAREVVQVDEYIEMITGKTAVLLSLCTELGALIAGQDENSIGHYAEFGLNLGLAFQVIDDILGIWGDESKTGKSAATDIITKKKTLPVLYGLERSNKLTDLYHYVEADDTFVREVVTLLDELGAREYASTRAATYSANARQHLQDANPTGEAGEALLQLADMLMQRDY
jgi:geranylgeranyl diphosphate synthase type I